MAKKKKIKIYDDPYAGAFLVYILEHDRIMKSELLPIANNRTGEATLKFLESKDLINIKEETKPRQIFWITLTDKGYNVAMKYKAINDIENGITPEPENNYNTSKESVSVMKKT